MADSKRKWRIVRVLLLLAMALYVGSYFVLTRQSLAINRLWSLKGFYYVPCCDPDMLFQSPTLRALNDGLKVFYRPIEWIDTNWFGGHGPGGYPMMSIGQSQSIWRPSQQGRGVAEVAGETQGRVGGDAALAAEVRAVVRLAHRCRLPRPNVRRRWAGTGSESESERGKGKRHQKRRACAPAGLVGAGPRACPRIGVGGVSPRRVLLRGPHGEAMPRPRLRATWASPGRE